MNPTIRQYFDAAEGRLITSPVVISYQVVRREIAASDGKLRIKLQLQDGGSAELFAYVAETDERIDLLKYSFHWQDAQGNLVRRWDNAPHYPHLPGAPHHVHGGSGSVQPLSQVPDLFSIIEQIEDTLQ
jgi:hypothetical protein